MKTGRTGLLLMMAPLPAVYTLTMPATLPDFDAGEFLVIAEKGGIAHPSGYVLLLAVYRLAVALFSEMSPVRILSSTSVIFAAAAAVCVAAVILESGKSRTTAAAAVYASFLSPPVWRLATNMEPFALNLFLSALCVMSLWKASRTEGASPRRERWLALTGLTFGLSFCNHHSMAFLLPSAALIWLFGIENRKSGGLWFAAGSAAGLLPLLYFFTEMPQGAYLWGDWSDPLARLPVHVLRKEYGTLSLMADNAGFWADGFIHFIVSLPPMLSWVFALPAAAGFFFLLERRGGRGRTVFRERPFDGAVLIAFLFTGVIFTLLFNLPAGDLAKMVAERFFALPILLAAFPAAEALHRLGRRVPSKVLLPAVLTALLLHGLNQWPLSDRSREWFYEAHVRNVFRTVEDDAVVVTDSDANHFGLLYGKELLGLGEGVTVVQAGIWGLDWYRRQIFHELGLEYPGGRPGLSDLIGELKNRRPLYGFVTTREDLSAHLEASYPVGPLVRLAGDGTEVPRLQEVYRENVKLLETYRLVPREGLSVLTPWESHLHAFYRRPWSLLADRFEREGSTRLASLCREHEAQMTPWPAP